MPAIYVRAAFRSTNARTGDLIVQVLHFECDTLTSPADYNGLATDIAAHFQTSYLGMLDVDSTFHDVTVTNETYTGAPVGQGLKSIELPGTRATPDTSVNPSLCGMVSLHTATPKRYARGHSFCPPVVDRNVLASGALIAAGSTYGVALTQFATLLQSAFTVSSTAYAPIVFSRTRSKLGLTPFQFPVTRVSWDTKQHWLRSRDNGR